MAKKKKDSVLGVVVPKHLNVRIKPNGNIVEILKCGSIVDVCSERSGWYKIQCGDISGWVAGQYIDVKEGE